MKGVIGFGPALLLTLTIGVTGCGGGGGSDGGGDPGGGSGPGDQSGDSLPMLDGLSGVANNDNWLFYTSNADGNSGLFGFNPMMPDNGAELIDEDAFLSASPYVFSTIAGADLSGSQMSNHRAHYLFYRSKEDRVLPGSGQVIPTPDGFQRVSTSQSATPGSPSRVSSEADATNLYSSRYFLQYHLSQPLDTAVAYRAGNEWRQVRVGDDASQPPLRFDEDHQVMVSLGDGAPNGWLVIDEGNGDQLTKVDMALNSQGPVVDQGGDPVDGLVHAQMLANLSLDKVLVVLTFEDPDTTDEEVPGSELWLYADGDPGTIKPLLNGAGEKLTFSRSLFSEGAALPSAEKLVIQDDTLYFSFHEQSGMDVFIALNPMLYRVDEHGWSREIDYSQKPNSEGPILASPFLIDAGDRLIWLIGDRLTSIELAGMSESTLYEGSISTPVPVSQGGWMFYNDQRGEDSAIAARTDGSRRIRLQNASWIGASSRGEGTALGRRAKSEISEVFLLKEDGTVAAVSATQPDAGMVTLGQLNPPPETVTMFGIRPGPHQLMRVQYEGESDDSYEVVYVNTLEAGSLRHLMSEPTDATNAGSLVRPVYSR